jgi:hypothetical protein
MAEEIFIIGAGIAGISAALALADCGYKITIFEQNTVGSGASGNNPGRMGLGFHYVDVDTAITYLRASIEVQRKYPDYLVGRELDSSHPIRHGRYFITKDSHNSPDEILKTYELLRQEYIRLIEKDPKNKVFGPPEDFYKILNPEQYKNDVNMSVVALGIETAECLFDIQRFIADRKKEIEAHPNIKLFEHTKVLKVYRKNYIKTNDPNERRYVVEVLKETSTSSEKYFTNYIVNAAWQNIEVFNNQVGVRSSEEKRTNRLKALLVVKLPESLLNKNSMFFCMGQHCMFTNMGNGYGMMTYAKETNIEASSDLNLSIKADRYLRGEISETEREAIQSSILRGVAHYIPEMAGATPVALKFGIVQTAGKLTLADLDDVNSSVHKRDYDGIKWVKPGFLTYPAIKLFYFEQNTTKVVKKFNEHIALESSVTNNHCVRFFSVGSLGEKKGNNGSIARPH